MILNCDSTTLMENMLCIMDGKSNFILVTSMKVTVLAMMGAVSIVGVTPVASFAQSVIRKDSLPVTSSQQNNMVFEGINNRSAQDDFSRFFGITGQQQSNSSSRESSATNKPNALQIKYDASSDSSDTPFILQPAEATGEWDNDGAQLQLNLQDLDRSSPNESNRK